MVHGQRDFEPLCFNVPFIHEHTVFVALANLRYINALDNNNNNNNNNNKI